MADIRINSLPTTASASSSDDFLALDGATNGTRKLNAYSPTFGGNLTVSGTGTISGSSLNVGAGARDLISLLPQAAGSGVIFATLNSAASAYTPQTWDASTFSFRQSGDPVLTITGSKLTTLAGNLTVSGTGTSDFSGNIRLENTKAIYGYTLAGATGALISSTSSNNLNVGQNNANWAALNLFGGTGNVDVYSGATGFVARFNTAGNVLIGTSTPTGEKLQVNGTAAISGALSIGNTVQTAASVASTHKVTISIGGSTYYLLATNV